MVTRFLPAFVLLLAGASAADLPREVVLLARARYHMSQVLTGLPNYTCLQTIERSQRQNPKRRPQMLDVVRIEVALVSGKELFAWPGSGKFTDTEISEMVRGGAIGTGSFALHAKAVFMGNAATYNYEGESLIGGRRTHKWTFTVPQMRSGYTLRVGLREATVGYSGAFWIDQDTMDAVRLEVRADDIPPALRLTNASDMVEYQRVGIGTEKFLLPAMAEMKMTDITGSENMNRTRFTGCKQYTGESTLIFDDPAPAAATSTPEPERTVDAPDKLTLDMSLETDINVRQAAVGDPITASLQRPLKLPGGIVVPKGALVHGRITHIRPGYWARYTVIGVGMKWHEIESGNTHVRINASLESLMTPGVEYVQRNSPGRDLRGQHPENETIFGSIIFIRDYASHIRRGIRMIWVTKPLQAEETQ